MKKAMEQVNEAASCKKCHIERRTKEVQKWYEIPLNYWFTFNTSVLKRYF